MTWCLTRTEKLLKNTYPVRNRPEKPKKRAEKRLLQTRLASHHELIALSRAVELRTFASTDVGRAWPPHPITKSGRSEGATPAPLPPGVPHPASSLLVEERPIKPSGYPAPAIGFGSINNAPRSDHRGPQIPHLQWGPHTIIWAQ